MPKHGKRKHKHRSGPAKPHKLLKYAALGKTGKLLSALAGTVAADLELYTPEGRTALHLAAEHGHLEVLKALLGAGASAKAEDFSGNTPAHLAAQHGQAAALVLLLEAGSSADPAATNNAGESIAHLTDALLGRDADEGDIGPVPPALSASEPSSGSLDFAERLRQEAGLEDDPYLQDADWYTGEAAFSGLPRAESEDEDAYAERIWRDMRRRAQDSQPSVTPATAAAWGPAAGSARQAGPAAMPATAAAGAAAAEQERQRRAAEASARSARILEEEQARDAAFRRAVLQGDVIARRAKYEARWATLMQQKGDLLGQGDIPWLGEDASDIEAVALAGLDGQGQDARRRRIRAELMRWHPDKFAARFGQRLQPGAAQQVSERVKLTSQVLNSLSQPVQDA